MHKALHTSNENYIQFYVGSKNLDLFKESTKKLQFLKKNMPNILER